VASNGEGAHEGGPRTRRFEGRGAAFLDRDGVINDNLFVNDPKDLVLLPEVGEAIARLNRANVPVVVITNQGGIAMGHLTEEMLEEIHAELASLLAGHGAHVDAIYYCPHHPDATLTAYRRDCPCRKPGIGMLEKARDDLGIDLSSSVLVGDSTSDILAGTRAGCRTILVRTGFAGADGKTSATPDDVVADVSEAVDRILEAPPA
jgi:D-glycero-D-manno-heptose 1,7-bisphosphate phosphatase